MASGPPLPRASGPPTFDLSYNRPLNRVLPRVRFALLGLAVGSFLAGIWAIYLAYFAPGVRASPAVSAGFAGVIFRFGGALLAIRPTLGERPESLTVRAEGVVFTYPGGGVRSILWSGSGLPMRVFGVPARDGGLRNVFVESPTRCPLGLDVWPVLLASAQAAGVEVAERRRSKARPQWTLTARRAR